MMDSWPCPEFRSGWDSYFKDKPDKPVMHYSVIAGWFGDHMVMPPGKFFTMVSTQILTILRCLTRECSSTS
jgi:alcohol oxidase